MGRRDKGQAIAMRRIEKQSLVLVADLESRTPAPGQEEASSRRKLQTSLGIELDGSQLGKQLRLESQSQRDTLDPAIEVKRPSQTSVIFNVPPSSE